MLKINIGCGDRKRDGYLNVDVCGTPDKVVDLSVFPWPFEDNSVDEVLSEHFLEHCVDFEKTMIEINRILKPGGINHFRVPHFRGSFTAWHLHRYQFSTVTCMLICSAIPYQFGGRKLFELESIKVGYIYARPILRRIFSFLANISPSKWDWLGLPIDEIECVCRKPLQS